MRNNFTCLESLVATKEQVASYLRNTCMAQGHQSRLSGDVVVYYRGYGGGGHGDCWTGTTLHLTALLL